MPRTVVEAGGDRPVSTILSDVADLADWTSPLDIAPVAGRIGAEIDGVRLGGDLDDEAVAAIRAALVRYKVIFFRNQHHLGDDGQEAFTERLGAAVKHPTVPAAAGSNFLLELGPEQGYGAASWHTDVTFVEAYPEASILRCLVAPKAGGDTLWANTVAAYEGLPGPLRAMCDQLWAVHSNVYDGLDVPELSEEARERTRRIFAATVYETEQPVVRVHPESGERSLVLGHFLKRFVALDAEDSSRLFRILQDQVTRPENTVRWRWRVGDVAIWDNRATQHRAVADFGTQNRVLRRSTLHGQVTVGVDGRRARTIKPVAA